jgi:hypothetical protein
MTFGYSRDDVAKFLPVYLKQAGTRVVCLPRHQIYPPCHLLCPPCHPRCPPCHPTRPLRHPLCSRPYFIEFNDILRRSGGGIKWGFGFA